MTIFWQAAGDAVMIVFLVHDVGLGPAAIGLLSMAGLLGAIATSMLTGRITRRWGEARVLVLATAWHGPAFALFAWTDVGWRLGVYVVAMLMVSACVILLRVLVASAWQLRSPERLRGRVGATMEFVVMGTLPIGSLAGGVLGTVVGLRPTMVIAGLGVGLSVVWLVCSPLRSARDLPRD
jgi:MFS family permease